MPNVRSDAADVYALRPNEHVLATIARHDPDAGAGSVLLAIALFGLVAALLLGLMSTDPSYLNVPVGLSGGILAVLVGGFPLWLRRARERDRHRVCPHADEYVVTTHRLLAPTETGRVTFELHDLIALDHHPDTRRLDVLGKDNVQATLDFAYGASDGVFAAAVRQAATQAGAILPPDPADPVHMPVPVIASRI